MRSIHISALLSCIAIVLQLLPGSTNASAQTTPRSITEKEIIVRAKKQAPQVLSANLAISLAETKARVSNQKTNPSLAWNREHFPGKGSDSEDTLVVSVPINLSNSRGVKRHINRASIATLKSNAARTRSEVVEYALSEFYLILALRESQRELSRKVKRVTKAAQIVSFRRESGKVSGYDQSRIEIEVELAASELREAQTRTTQLSTSLALFLGLDPQSTSFSGTLAAMPTPTQPQESLSLQWLRKAAVHSGRARQAAKKRWLPKLVLSGGMRLGLSDETRYGYVAGVSINLPIFSNKDPLRDQTNADKLLADARIAVIQTTQSRKQRRAHLALVAARDEVLLLSDKTKTLLKSIEKGAESGYREGQISLAELLDAQRLESTVAERKLTLVLSMKQAELAFRAARGEFE